MVAKFKPFLISCELATELYIQLVVKVLPFLMFEFGIEPINGVWNIDAWSWPQAITLYRTAGNFCMVLIFAYFACLFCMRK